jgi:uncharacterized protein YndB with AHSA1/START domain
MNNVTKIKIDKPAHDVFEAFVDPAKIGSFWFSSSSERWEQGKTVTLTYEEYDASVDIQVLEIVGDRKIVFQWGGDGQGNVVTIALEPQGEGSTVVQVTEEGFEGSAEELMGILVDNKEGWVYALTCLKAYLEFGIHSLRASLVKG